MPAFDHDANNDTYVPDHQRSADGDGRSGVPQTLADRYLILEEIGSGATAITYRGHDRRLNRNVAIKILRQDHALDTNYVQRFEREARAAASISQGNVVDVYDFGEQDGALYIVMQYIDGENLKHDIMRHGAIEPIRARRLTTQILAGLAAIHAAGIIHRDIKPQNVLIGRDGIARVTDFGVAQAAVDVGLTTAGTTVGTAAYMAPEQAQAGTVGEATDIYATGVVLYEMLTGTMPFTAPTPVAMMLAHIQQDPIPPSARAPGQGIPADLDGIVMQAMAKDPADRFRSANAMSRALAGGTAGAGATTVLSIAPATARAAARGTAPYASGHSVGANGVPPSRDPMADAWPAAPVVATAGAAPGSMVQPRRAGSRLRGAVGGLLMLLLLASAVAAAYGANQLFGDDNGNAEDTTPTAPATELPVLFATGEPTQTVAATEPPTEALAGEPAAVPTTVPTAVPSEVPTQTPAPTETPTAPPAVTPTSPPTEVPIPTPVPTAVPTAVPAEQPTIEPAGDGSDVAPTEPGQGSNVANNVSSLPASNLDTSRAGQNPGQITIGSNEWQGAGVEAASGQEWTVVGAGEEATAAFEVVGTLSTEPFQVSIAIAAVDTRQVPLSVLINGTERLRITDPLPTVSSGGEGQILGTLVLTVPSAYLEDGQNEITIVNEGSTESNDWAQSDDDDDGDDDGNSGAGNGNGNGAKEKDTNKKSSSGQSNGLEAGSIVLGEAVVTVSLRP